VRVGPKVLAQEPKLLGSFRTEASAVEKSPALENHKDRGILASACFPEPKPWGLLWKGGQKKKGANAIAGAFERKVVDTERKRAMWGVVAFRGVGVP